MSFVVVHNAGILTATATNARIRDEWIDAVEKAMAQRAKSPVLVRHLRPSKRVASTVSVSPEAPQTVPMMAVAALGLSSPSPPGDDGHLAEVSSSTPSNNFPPTHGGQIRAATAITATDNPQAAEASDPYDSTSSSSSDGEGANGPGYIQVEGEGGLSCGNDLTAAGPLDGVKATGEAMETPEESMEVTNDGIEKTAETKDMIEENMEMTEESIEVTKDGVEKTDDAMEVTEESMEMVEEALEVSEEGAQNTRAGIEVTEETIEIQEEGVDVVDLVAEAMLSASMSTPVDAKRLSDALLHLSTPVSASGSQGPGAGSANADGRFDGQVGFAGEGTVTGDSESAPTRSKLEPEFFDWLLTRK